MKIATWNVNSLRVRLPQLLEWLGSVQPDVVALQETKLPDEAFPLDEIRAAGYHAAFSGQKTYNGVALLTRTPIENVIADPPGLDGSQRRVLAGTVGPVRVIDLYVPNGSEVGSDKYQYKLDWLSKVRDFLAVEMARHPYTIVLGDFNIAPEDRDVYDPEIWRESVLCSTPEREAFRALLDLGLVDLFRRFEQPEGSFTWWDYRAAAFRRNHGLRIDHILATPAMVERCIACSIDKGPRKLERPSDHAPVIAEFVEP